MNRLDTGLVGLDFGSSKTMISILRKGALEIILNECSMRETHNIVGFTDKETLIGDQAFMKLKSNYKNTILYPIRYINPGLLSDESHYNNEAKWQSATLNIEKNSSLTFEVAYLGVTKRFQPIQIIAFLLGFFYRKIVKASKFVYSQYGFVLSVPGFFTTEERLLLSQAAQIASINLLKIVNESAVIGLIYKKIHDEDLQLSPNGKRVLFVDVGYSKTGIFLLSFLGSNVTLIQETYDRFMGVRDIDNLLLEFYQEIIKKGCPDYKESYKMRLRVLESIEKQRKILSANNDAHILVESLIEDYDLNYTMTRQEFEKIISPFLEQLNNLFLKFKVEANLFGKSLDIDVIEIIGGGVRIPSIQKLIMENYNSNSLSKTLNTTECFAMGSALYCNKAAGLPINPPIGILNEVLYYSIFCGVKPKGINEIMVFNRGVSYPCVTTTLLPKDDAINSIVFYYKSDEKIYVLYEINIEKENKGSITIHSGVNDDGIFIIKDLKINEKKCQINFENNIMGLVSEIDMMNYIKEYEQIEKNDKMIQESYEIKNQMESYIYSKRSDLLEKYRAYIPENHHPGIKKIFEEYEHWLYNHDDTKSQKVNYESKLKELKEKIEPIYLDCHEKNELALLNQQEITSLHQLKEFVQSQKQIYIDRLNINLFLQRIGDGGGMFGYFKEGVKKLKDFVNHFKIQETLRLDLRNNELSDKAIDYLIEILETQKDITCLDLRLDNENSEGRNVFSDKMIFRVCENLKNLYKLKSLTLGIENMDEINFRLLTIFLENLANLEKAWVKIGEGKISKEALQYFLGIKLINKNLKSCKLIFQGVEINKL